MICHRVFFLFNTYWRNLTTCAESREVRSCLVMLSSACQNLHSWNVNDAELELQAIKAELHSGPHTRSLKITLQVRIL